MIIKKIIDLCKKCGYLCLYESENEQWISDGFAIYPLFNLPRFSLNTLCKTYDITDKQQEKIVMSLSEALPDCYCYADAIENESECEEGKIYISRGKGLLIPYSTSTGIAFVASRFLAPLADADGDYLKLFERHTPSGEMYFAVKAGLVLVGIIQPSDYITQDFVDDLKLLAAQCDVSLYNKKRNEMLESEIEYAESMIDGGEKE